MISAINPFLNFNGDADAAIALYQSAVGAEVESLMRFAEMPGEEAQALPKEMARRVMYARLNIGGGVVELSDVPPNVTVSPGSNNAVACHIDDPKELDRMVAALAEGGRIEMGPEDMFWGARYAQVVDRFGVSWQFNCQLNGGC